MSRWLLLPFGLLIAVGALVALATGGDPDPADGPAFFVICLTCIPVVAFSVWLEVGFGAAYWLNALLTLPLLFVFCVLPLRPIKGMMVAQQYRHDAKEGVWDDKPRRQP